MDSPAFQPRCEATWVLSEEDEGREILEEIAREGVRTSNTKKRIEKESTVEMDEHGGWAENLVGEFLEAI